MNFNDLEYLLDWNLQEALRSPLYFYLLILFLFLVLTFWSLRKVRRDLVSVFSDKDGKVQITPHALQELVKRTCEEMNGIFFPNTSIKKNGNSIRLHVRLVIKTDCNIKETREELRRKLEIVMVEKLNFDNFGGIDLVIKGFKENSA